MCPGTESRGIINGRDPLIPKDGGDYNEATMRPLVVEGGDGGSGGDSGFLQGFLQRLFPANGLLRTLPLSEVSLSLSLFLFFF